MFNRSKNISTILIKFMVYQDSQPPTIFAPKADGLEVEILLLKMFSLKQKIKNFQLLNFASSRKQPHVLSDLTTHSSRQEITMGSCETKAIQADL